MGFNQKINDSMNNMSRSVTTQMMKDAPPDLKYVYIGPVDEKTRPFCLDAAAQGALTEAQILELGGEYAESLVSGGGINCRHNWELASDDIQSQFHRGSEAQKIIEAKEPVDILSPKMAGKHKTIEDATKWAEKNGVEKIQTQTKNINTLNEINVAISKIPANIRKDIVVTDFAAFKSITGFKLAGKSNNYGVSTTMSKLDTKILSFQEKKLLMQTGRSGEHNIVGINTRKYSTLDKISDRKVLIQKQYFEKTGRNYFFNTKGQITVHHEFGHIVHNNLSRMQRDSWDNIAKKWADSTNYDLLKAKQSYTEHFGEAFAEAWGCYHAGNKKLLPNEVIDFIESIL